MAITYTKKYLEKKAREAAKTHHGKVKQWAIWVGKTGITLVIDFRTINGGGTISVAL